MNRLRTSKGIRSKTGPCLFPVFLVFLAFTLVSCGGGGEEPNSPPSVTTLDASPLAVDGVTLNGTVNPNGHETTAWFKWGTDPNFSNGFFSSQPQILAAGRTAQNVSFPLRGQSSGYFQAVASNVEGEVEGEIKSFSTTPGVPGATTGQATDVTGTGATLNGTVNPNGLSTNAWFEWGEDPELASFSTTAVQPMGVGTTGVPVEFRLPDILSEGTTYYFRVAAENAAGSAKGTILSFTPRFLPTVTTESATDITVTEPSAGVTFNGLVNPNGVSTDAWFRYGTDPSLSSYDETDHELVGSATENQPVSVSVNTLEPWKTYYFQVVAENTVGGSQEGTISSFPAGDYYVAIGDSITFGSHDDYPPDDTSSDGRNTGGGYEPILNDLLTAEKGYPHTVENEGFSGETAADGLARIQGIIDSHPDARYFLVMYGTNDAFLDLPPVPSGLGLNPGDPGYSGSYKDYMQRMISAIIAAGKTPYLAKVPYTSDPLISDTYIRNYNFVIDELIFDNEILVIPPDFYSHFQSHPGELDDGIHPNGIGYQSMADRWFDALTAP